MVVDFDKDDYMMELFHFYGTTVIYNNGDIYKHRYMYVYDVETKSFVWTNDLREYVIQKFGDISDFQEQIMFSMIFQILKECRSDNYGK